MSDLTLQLDYAETRRLRGRADRLRCTIEVIMRELVAPGLITLHNALSLRLVACEELIDMTVVSDDHIGQLNAMIKWTKSIVDTQHPCPHHFNFNF